MTSPFLAAVAAHLSQSTLFALAAGCLTLALRRNSARIRWFVWLAASLKFLAPFALLTALGAQFPWPSGPIHLVPAFLAAAGQTTASVTQISGAPAVALAHTSQGAGYGDLMLCVLEVAWALGTFFVAARWFSRWLRLRRVLRESTVSSLPFTIPVRLAASQLEPAVIGILRPVLLLPADLVRQLGAEELDAVLAHERCHVAWRDNLAASAHMLVEALFWFHPLIWWLGKRLVDERERACDERVLAQGHAARRYAEGILKVCEHYLQSPLSSVAGVGGGILSRRIAVILQNRLIQRLSVVQKLMVTVATCATLGIPLAIGSLSAPYAAAAAATADSNGPVLRNVVIKLGQPPFSPGLPHNELVWFGLVGENGADVQLAYTTLRGFVATAYGVHGSQVVGKDLSKEPQYSITAENPWPEDPTASGEQRAARYWNFSNGLPSIQRNLLATRFGLVAKRERRRMDGYVLTVGPSGSKLQPDTTASYVEQGIGQSDRELIATMAPVSTIVRMIEDMFDAPVVDGTGLKGAYDYRLTWTPPPAGTTPSPATMAKALEELGLHLEARPVTVDVINVVSLKSPEQVLASK